MGVDEVLQQVLKCFTTPFLDIKMALFKFKKVLKQCYFSSQQIYFTFEK